MTISNEAVEAFWKEREEQGYVNKREPWKLPAVTEVTKEDLAELVTKACAERDEKIKELEKVAYKVPLCGDHAVTWFTARHFKPGDCWFCQYNRQLAKMKEARPTSLPLPRN